MSSEELIRDLCSRLIAAQGPDFVSAASELHAALKTHMEAMRAMAANALLNPPVPDPPEA